MGAKAFWRSIRWWEAGPTVAISGDGAAQAGGGGKSPAKGGDEGHEAVAIRIALRGTWEAVVKIVSFWLLILSHLRT